MSNSFLSRTPGSTTDAQRKQFTISVWVKRSDLLTGSNHHEVLSAFATDQFGFRFQGDNKLDIFDYSVSGNNYPLRLVTNRLFRDTSAWYHIVLQVDTPNSTSSDRVKLWVNGVQETSFGTANYPSQDYTTSWNKNGLHQIGSKAWGNSGNGSDMFPGYLAHVANVAGSVVAPTSFGQTDSTSGIWKFKTPSCITWGNNGFHLKFENAGAMGTDSSGNSNTFTVNGNLKQSLDTPSNVYSVINQLTYSASQVTIQNGALSKAGTPTSNAWRSFYGTLGASNGKYYFEMKVDQIENSDPNNFWVGIVDIEQMTHTANNQQFYKQGRGYGYHAQSGSTGNNNQTFSYGNSWTAGDIIGVAMDLDNAKMYFSKNGTWQNSGVPTSGSTGTGAFIIAANITYVPAFSQYYANEQFSLNFGNGFFGTTAITSAGSNGNGSLFEYDVPNGYYALNTKNINTYG